MALLWFVLLPLTLAVNATSRPPGPLGPPAPVSYQDVAFRTADGVRLSAWYIPPRNGAAVVLLPGAGSTCGTVLGRAEPRDQPGARRRAAAASAPRPSDQHGQGQGPRSGERANHWLTGRALRG
jgi:dipeptidyl aminopeptidase/acylaminoacyl peptidase